MTEWVGTTWFHPKALVIGLIVASLSAARHIYLFNNGIILHSPGEHVSCAAAVSCAFSLLWLVSTFYVFSGNIFMSFVDLAFIGFTSIMITWQLGRSLAAMYTIRKWHEVDQRFNLRKLHAA